MNSNYRSIWNEKTGTFVAGSENAMRAGRSTSCRESKPQRNARFFLKALTVSLFAAFGGSAYALPVGGVVVQGGAGISNGAGSTTITQSSQNVAINWQSFSIGAGEAVRFLQPNSSSIALNRVLGTDPSSILGSMSANGKVFLLNPNGILFGLGSQVNVGGLVASTLNMTDSDFMTGNYRLSGSSNASVVNQGTISAPGGYVALLGANVGNDGTITARLGTVALAAGNAMTLDVAGDGLLNVTVSQGAVNALAQNGGLIQADGGNVLLTAMAAGDLLQSAVNNTGVIRAQSIDTSNGTIRLLGDMQSGTMNISGTLDASGTGAGQTGGNVTVTGHHVGLFGANINASGDAGGGTVLIGGDYQGKNPTVQNAAATYMSADSSITADAISNGKGGKVILWSDESTRVNGSIAARGGAFGGDGGLIETSAHSLDVAGIRIDASAPNGASGLWLLDPADITIDGGPTAGTPVAPVGGVYAPNTGLNAANINVTDLVNALQAGGGTNVTITTTNTGVAGTPSAVAPNSGLGDITIAAALTWSSPATPATLTLNAGGDVNFNAAVTHGDGNLVVCCGRDINIRAAITTAGGGGSVSLNAGRDITLFAAGAITSTVGNVTMCAGNDITLSGKLTMTNAGTGVLAGGLPGGLVLSAGNSGNGTGTLRILAVGAGRPELTRASATPMDISIFYNPVLYTAPTDYSSQLIINTPTITLTQFMLVHPEVVTKPFDGTTVAAFTGALLGLPPGVTLALPGTANFDTPAIGANKTVSFTGATLTQGPTVTGGAGINYAFTNPCCGPAVSRTTGTVIAALPVVPPVPPAAPPVDYPDAEEMLGPESLIPGGVLLSQLPGVTLAALPPQLLSIAPPPRPVVVPPPVVQEAPPVYVPPVRPAKQDRN